MNINSLVFMFELIQRWQLAHHSVDGDVPLAPLLGFPGLLPAADLLRRQSQQPAHLLPEEVAVSIVNGSIVGQYFQARHLVTLKGKHQGDDRQQLLGSKGESRVPLKKQA